MDPLPSTPSRILEITLVSAQDLHRVSNNMKTYAVVWLQHNNKNNNNNTNNNKQATNVDQAGGTDPTWNDKFMFRVDDKFLNSEDATVFVEIYAAAWENDALVGYVNILVKDIIDTTGTVAVQICRPSGPSQGILNIEVAHKYPKMEGNGSMLNGSIVGSSICNSDVGPSISVVAAAIEKGLYNPQANNQNYQPKEATQIKEWNKEERANEVRRQRPLETPAGSIVAIPYQSSKRRSSKGKKNEGTKLFSCLGCEISVTCGGGEDRKKNKKKHEHGSNKVYNLSSVNDA